MPRHAGPHGEAPSQDVETRGGVLARAFTEVSVGNNRLRIGSGV